MDECNQGVRQVSDALNDLLETLRRRLRVNSLIVFGSRARGDYLLESDVDVAVVSADFAGRSVFERLEPIMESWQGHVAVEAVAFTPEELASCESPVCWDVLEEGIPIYDDGTFARAKDRFQEHKKRHKLRKVELVWEWEPEAV